MDDVVNRFARELADAIAAAVAENPQVEACREKARAAGFEMKVTLEAVVDSSIARRLSALAKVTPSSSCRRANSSRRARVSKSPPTIAVFSARCGLLRTKRQKRSTDGWKLRSKN